MENKGHPQVDNIQLPTAGADGSSNEETCTGPTQPSRDNEKGTELQTATRQCHGCEASCKLNKELYDINSFSEPCQSWMLSQPESYSKTDVFCEKCNIKIITQFINSGQSSRPRGLKRSRTTQSKREMCPECCSILTRNKKQISKLGPHLTHIAKELFHHDDSESICRVCYMKIEKACQEKMAKTNIEPPASANNTEPPITPSIRPTCLLENHPSSSEIPNCDKESEVKTTTADYQTIKELFKLDDELPMPTEISLCATHMEILKLKRWPKYCCLCSNYIGRQEHARPLSSRLMNLIEGDESEMEVNSCSKICIKCRLYTDNFKHIATGKLSDIESKCRQNLTTCDKQSEDQLHMIASYQTTIKLIEQFQMGKAVLLAEVFSWFSECLIALKLGLPNQADSNTSIANTLTRSEKRLAKINIFYTLGDAMSSHTPNNNKKSILLYPSGDGFDPFTALHDAVSQNWFTKDLSLDNQKMSEKLKRQELDLDAIRNRSLSDKIKEISKDLSGLITKQCKTVTDHFKQTKIDDLTKFDLHDTISVLDPLYWNFICFMTSNQKERKNFSNSDFDWSKHHTVKLDENSSQMSIRRHTRRSFLAFSLLYAKDEKANGLMILLADKINKYSLSVEQMNFFNRLGVCVSYTTYSRFVKKVSKKMKRDGPSKFLTPNTFTICTMDNIDKAMPCASIKSSDEKRPAMHATSICFMQPAPQKFTNTTETASRMCKVCSQEISVGSTCLRCEVLTDADLLGKPREQPKTSSGIHVSDDESTGVADSMVRAPPPFPSFSAQEKLSMADFQITKQEDQALKCFSTETLTYALERTVHASEVCEQDREGILVPGLKCKTYLLQKETSLEKSNYAYLPIVNKPADDKETIDDCLQLVKKHADNFQSPTEPLVVAGDAKTYQLLQDLKRSYGEQLDWVFPFVGDFHILMNTQPVIMKIFWDAGLREFGKENFKTSFYQNHLKDCSKFRTNHEFFLQIWEALYQYQIESFMKWRTDRNSVDMDTFNQIGECLKSLSTEVTSNFHDVTEFIEKQRQLEEPIQRLASEFAEFRNVMSEKDKTFKFWDGFVHKQVFSYIGLWIAIRSGNWDLRLGCLKQLAPLFHAFDRQNYAKIVVEHLADVARMPQHILAIMRDGGFVISLSGTPLASVAFDEAHEMTINKDLKSAITVAYDEYVVTKSEYLPFRAYLQKALDKAFLITRKQVRHKQLAKSSIQTEQNNVLKYKQKIAQSKAFEVPVDNSDKLVQLYTNVKAHNQQDKDLMHFESIGQEYLEDYINLFILKRPRDKIVVKRKNLKTFSAKQRDAKRKSQQEKDDLKAQYFALKAQAAESAAKNLPINQVGQLIALPRAIAQSDKLPVKGQKSNATKFLAKRYKDKKVIVEGVQPSQYVSPDSVILEGMFLVNTKPRNPCKTFGDYAQVLLKRWILKWFAKGTIETHVVFDNPDTSGPNPKDIERQRRYGKGASDKTACADSITAATRLPGQKWTDFLANRQNKRQLCHFLSDEWCKTIETLRLLKPDQKFITSGGFMDPERRYYATAVTSHGVDSKYFPGNHTEGDTNCWLHAHHAQGKNIQIFSPDTDIYHIGLTHLGQLGKQVVVQINMPGSKLEKFVFLNELTDALIHDQDLNSSVHSMASAYLQVVYICSGCDYVSYFTKLGKPTFYRLAFQYSNFIWNGKINHDEHVAGSFESLPNAQCENCNAEDINDTCPSCSSKIVDSACAFFRLIGVIYYCKFSSMFSAFDSPVHHFAEVTSKDADDKTPYQLHAMWLNDIRDRVWQRYVYEDEVLPSNDALFLHWKRCVWVMLYYNQALQQNITTPDILKYGWQTDQDTGELSIKWDLPENMDKVRQFVKVLQTKCNCKTSGCAKPKPNGHCNCYRNAKSMGIRSCSKLCRCQGKCSFPEVAIGHQTKQPTIPVEMHGSNVSVSSTDQSDIEPDSEPEVANDLTMKPAMPVEIYDSDVSESSTDPSDTESSCPSEAESDCVDYDIPDLDYHHNMPLEDDLLDFYVSCQDDDDDDLYDASHLFHVLNTVDKMETSSGEQL